MASNVVSAVKPSTSRALVTSGTRIATSCAYGSSLTYWNGASGPLTIRQISLARSSTVVDSAVERLKSSLRAASCSIASTMPRARSPPYV
jgi:hypothetical protein